MAQFRAFFLLLFTWFLAWPPNEIGCATETDSALAWPITPTNSIS